jgi:hypothetical protein
MWSAASVLTWSNCSPCRRYSGSTLTRLKQMLRRSISVMLAGLLIAAPVAIFVLMLDKVAVAVAALCLIAGAIWLYSELSDLRRGQ